LLSARGGGPGTKLLWRARHRDDDGRIWRARAARAEDLIANWEPAKPSTGPVAALGSLRPVNVDVRVEAPDGRAAARTLTRQLLGDGVRVRRWREGAAAALYLPAADAACATVLVDATAGEDEATVATLAAALLASRGALVLAVTGRARGGPGDPVAAARELLAAVPSASSEIELLTDGVPLPPGIGDRGAGRAAVAARTVAWDALLTRLGARPRHTGDRH
jgi:hypothetical protein